MAPINPIAHKLSGRHCPHCSSPLRQVISSGLEFCPNDPACHYEQSNEILQAKVSKLLAKRLEVAAAARNLIRVQAELAEIEGEPDWVRFVELLPENLNHP
ncbi:MAG: hypothetical protein ACRC8Q_10885 [Aeromonas sp.]